MVDAKCIDVDEKDHAAAKVHCPSSSNCTHNDQWQALVELHKTLLHEHHDFFLASQHLSARTCTAGIAPKYSMYEISGASRDKQLENKSMGLSTAGSIGANPYEEIPSIKDTWTECIGELYPLPTMIVAMCINHHIG